MCSKNLFFKIWMIEKNYKYVSMCFLQNRKKKSKKIIAYSFFFQNGEIICYMAKILSHSFMTFVFSLNTEITQGSVLLNTQHIFVVYIANFWQLQPSLLPPYKWCLFSVNSSTHFPGFIKAHKVIITKVKNAFFYSMGVM